MDDARKMKREHARAIARWSEIAQAMKGVNQYVARQSEFAQALGGVNQYVARQSEFAQTLRGFNHLRSSARQSEFVQVAKAANKLQGIALRPEIAQAAEAVNRLQGVARSPEIAKFQETLRAFAVPPVARPWPTIYDIMDSASRPTGANPLRFTTPYSVRPTPKPTPRKTAPNPVARLRDLGNPIAADYCKEAIELLELGYYRSSAHSSICAVESVVREFNPKEDFEQVIAQMRADGAIHPAFAETVKKLWGYSSNQPGIRHADYPSSPFPRVSAKDARMLCSICPSIAEYLADAQD